MLTSLERADLLLELVLDAPVMAGLGAAFKGPGAVLKEGLLPLIEKAGI
jgi:hypothetical protein